MAAKTHVARPMNDASNFNSQVDIICPFYGQYEKVTALLESLFRLTRSNFYHVYLVDDASPNAEFGHKISINSQKNASRLKQSNILTLIRHEEQKGFAAACKTGYLAGESPYVCFLNSDCRIEDTGWLRNMGESLLKLKLKGVRVISPMTNNPVGGDPAQLGEKFDRSEEDVILEDSFLTLYCFMCHRELFPRIGGFLKEYNLGCHEDKEFAWRLRRHDFKQAVCRSSWVYHEGMATLKPLWRDRPNLHDVMMVENHQRYLEDIQTI